MVYSRRNNNQRWWWLPLNFDLLSEINLLCFLRSAMVDTRRLMMAWSHLSSMNGSEPSKICNSRNIPLLFISEHLAGSSKAIQVIGVNVLCDGYQNWTVISSVGNDGGCIIFWETKVLDLFASLKCVEIEHIAWLKSKNWFLLISSRNSGRIFVQNPIHSLWTSYEKQSVEPS